MGLVTKSRSAMESYAGQPEKPAEHSAAGPLLTPQRVRRVRAVLAATAALAVVLIALLHDHPAVMLVGMAPLALIAAELAWHLFDDRNGGA
jgi:hypothetical protein